jgi:excisionase family DNA binding protein
MELTPEQRPASERPMITHTTATPERLWTTAQLAEYLGVPVKTIHQWRYVQKGPRGFRVGRHLRFRPADVRAWEDEQLAASA